MALRVMFSLSSSSSYFRFRPLTAPFSLSTYVFISALSPADFFSFPIKEISFCLYRSTSAPEACADSMPTWFPACHSSNAVVDSCSLSFASFMANAHAPTAAVTMVNGFTNRPSAPLIVPMPLESDAVGPTPAAAFIAKVWTFVARLANPETALPTPVSSGPPNSVMNARTPCSCGGSPATSCTMPPMVFTSGDRTSTSPCALLLSPSTLALPSVKYCIKYLNTSPRSCPHSLNVPFCRSSLIDATSPFIPPFSGSYTPDKKSAPISPNCCVRTVTAPGRVSVPIFWARQLYLLVALYRSSNEICPALLNSASFSESTPSSFCNNLYIGIPCAFSWFIIFALTLPLAYALFSIAPMLWTSIPASCARSAVFVRYAFRSYFSVTPEPSAPLATFAMSCSMKRVPFTDPLTASITLSSFSPLYPKTSSCLLVSSSDFSR